jgi:hypothetical protein|tara:strand:+ start:282 stop:809 length:528 start_codon:yes stop_codon:yes gene_type:complete
MARSLKGLVEVKVSGKLTNDSSGAEDSFGEAIVNSFSSGTAANKAQRFWEDQRALTASQAEDIDVFDFGSIDIGAGAGLDTLGQALALTGIKALLVQNLSTSAGAVHVGNKNATTAWNSMFNADDTGQITLAPGASFLYVDPSAAGLAVADTSNHLLTFTDAGSGCTYKVTLLGI